MGKDSMTNSLAVAMRLIRYSLGLLDLLLSGPPPPLHPVQPFTHRTCLAQGPP